MAKYRTLEELEHISDAVGTLKNLGVDHESVIYIILRSVSHNGTARVLQFLISYRNKVVDISPQVAIILGMELDKNGGVKVKGVGMDMGWYVINALQTAIFNHPIYKQPESKLFHTLL